MGKINGQSFSSVFISKNAILNYNLNKYLHNDKFLLDTIDIKREFAYQINDIRKNKKNKKDMIKSSELNGMILIMEVLLFVFHKYQKDNPNYDIDRAVEFVDDNIEKEAFINSIKFFREEFKGIRKNTKLENKEIFGELKSESIDTEGIFFLWLANNNSAFRAFSDIFDEQILIENTEYEKIIKDLKTFYENSPNFMDGKNQNIIELLTEPSRKHPNSILEQLKFIIENWKDILGDYMSQLLSGIDFIKEEEKFGFGGAGKQEILSYTGIDLFEEREKFSMDKDWMPNLVLLAKTVFVWLFQLSKKYNRNINRLDEIPDEELDELARSGITGLWLIGIWERSRASENIKRICGNPEAISSAYSIYDYRVADSLGGEEALENLKSRSMQRGIRLGADMVPNHMGIDSPWVADKPEHFIHLDYCPYPSHSFNGPNLSSRDDIEIKIEDHYYDKTDAAVEFQYRDKKTGKTYYIYHGNDGTSMPWNDTAQLNYLNKEVREAAIQTILAVSRRFPIIRFDAAMTLTKLHYHRLWFPEPGSGGDIPTRSEHGMSKEEFSRLMGEEFWSEVVRRVAEESNDTLLLAEAFWLMEAYFVRNLGMHRVYNSAFMNFLKNEKNAQFRTSIKNTIEFNPEILKRFVNFLNNPDEETAVVQFGKDDKYFGVTILVSTLPGLPMFGHGQIDGYSEKYGMEYKRPYWDEKPDEWLLERHKREIFPLLKKRYIYSGVKNFRLFDFYLNNGSVNENVIAYSNRYNNESSLIIYNNKFENTAGWINISSAYLKIQGNEKNLIRENLIQSLGLNEGVNRFVIFRDCIRNIEFIRRIDDLGRNGLFVELNAFKYHVFTDFRQIEDGENGMYSKINSILNGRGVVSVDDAIEEFIFKPLNDEISDIIIRLTDKETDDYIDEKLSKALDMAIEIEKSEIVNELLIDEFSKDYEIINKKLDNLPNNTNFILNKENKGILYIIIILNKFEFVFGKGIVNKWILPKIIENISRKREADYCLELIRALSAYKMKLSELAEKKKKIIKADILDFLSENDVKKFLKTNIYQGIEWFNKERAEDLLQWCLALSIIEILKYNKKPEKKIAEYIEISSLILNAINRSEYHFDKLLKYIEGY